MPGLTAPNCPGSGAELPSCGSLPRRLVATAGAFADEALALLFPPRCVSCGDFEHLLCPGCRSLLEPLGEAGCRRCGGPRGRGLRVGYCPECLTRVPAFESARSAFIYRGPARELVAAVKGGGRRDAGRLMAELAASSFCAWVPTLGSVALVPVPSHRSVQRRRGYNQAEVFAQRLAALSGQTVVDLLTKVKQTSHQQGLDRAARQSNLRGAFALRSESRLQGEMEGLVVVDDVYTTGATAGEVAGVVAQGTGLPVHVFTFCRTPLAGGLTTD